MHSLCTLFCAALQVGYCLAFLHFHFGGVKEQVDFNLLDYHLSLFYTEMSVFSFESCQCAEVCGFWNLHRFEDLDFLTAYFVWNLHLAVICHYLELFTVYLGFLSENIIQDRSNNIHGFLKKCFFWMCFSWLCLQDVL